MSEIDNPTRVVEEEESGWDDWPLHYVLTTRAGMPGSYNTTYHEVRWPNGIYVSHLSADDDEGNVTDLVFRQLEDDRVIDLSQATNGSWPDCWVIEQNVTSVIHPPGLKEGLHLRGAARPVPSDEEIS